MSNIIILYGNLSQLEYNLDSNWTLIVLNSPLYKRDAKVQNYNVFVIVGVNII